MSEPTSSTIIRIRMRRVATDPTLFGRFNTYSGFCYISAKMIAVDVRDRFKIDPIILIEIFYRPDNTGLDFSRQPHQYIEARIPAGSESNDELTQLQRGEKVAYVLSPSETWEYTLEEDRTTNLLENSTSSTITYVIPHDKKLHEVYDIERLPNPFKPSICDDDFSHKSYGSEYMTACGI